MPVVDLRIDRIIQLLNGDADKKLILNTLPFLGLDIESETDTEVRIEYSPNRPDYATEFGIVAGLEGLLGFKKGMIPLVIESGKEYIIKVAKEVVPLRPHITGIIATGGKLNDQDIKQLVNMQEDLHEGIGRKRSKSSIGIHDLDKIKFPLSYVAVSREHKFIPLNADSACTISQILAETKTGKDYSHLLEKDMVPLIIDSDDKTVSLPPVINAAETTVTTSTKNLFVEVTGVEEKTGIDIASVIAITLQNMGFELHAVDITGQTNDNMLAETSKIHVQNSMINHALGTELQNSVIIDALKKCRLDAKSQDNEIICIIPRYRFDIINEMDIVEEVMLGYGIEKLESKLVPSSVIGQKNSQLEMCDTLERIMIGLGYTEVLNSSLTSPLKNDTSESVKLLNSKNTEHIILRNTILAGLIKNLSKNIHETYPQKIFEIGRVFLAKNIEQDRLACVLAYKNADYSQMKSVLNGLLCDGLGESCSTPKTMHKFFENGKTAKIIINEKEIGIIGQISIQIQQEYKIRVPVVGFEIQLDPFYKKLSKN